MRTFKMYFPEIFLKFQVYNAVLLTVVAMLYIFVLFRSVLFKKHYKIEGVFYSISQVAQWERIRLQNRRDKRCRFNPWVRKIPWSRKWQRTPGFLPQKLQGQRSLVGHRPWGHKESDISEHTMYSRSKIYYSLVRRRA